MGAELSTFEAVLNEYYLSGAEEAINRSVVILNKIKKGNFRWSGKQCTARCHISGNTGVGWRAEKGALPSAGNQGYVELAITAKYIYGSFELTGQVMASADGKNSAVEWADAELGGLVDDLNTRQNKDSYYGGRVRGYINSTAAWTTTSDTQISGVSTVQLTADGGLTTVQYQGDFETFASCDSADHTTWIRVELFRTDTGNPVDEVGAAPNPNPNIMVIDSDPEAGTLDMIYLTDTAGPGGDGLDPSTIAGDNCIALALHDTRAVDGDVPAAAFGVDPATLMIDEEVMGIFSNLSLPTSDWFGKTRHYADAAAVPAVASDGDAKILLSRVIKMNTAAGGARIDLTLPRLEYVDSKIDMDSGHRAETIMMSPLQRQRYMALLIGTIEVRGDKATKGDGGFTSYSFGDRELITDKDLPNGIYLFLTMKKWKRAELQAGGFAMVGSGSNQKIAWISGYDKFEGFWRAYYNIVSLAPHASRALVGMTL